MLRDIFGTVFAELVTQEGEEPDDMLMVIMGIIVATVVTTIAVITALPLLLGEDHESIVERIWKYKWVYVLYAAIGVGVLAFVRYGYSRLLSGGAAITVLLVYGMVVGVVRYTEFSTDIPGVNWLKQIGKAGPDEFELPMSDIVDKSTTASRRPILDQEESTLVIGSSRSGKTSALKLLAAQLDYSETAVFAHGSVGEYTEYFEQDLGMETITIGVRRSSVRWNLFREAETERELELIAKGLFGDGDDYFETSARQVFAAVLKLLDREVTEPSHHEIHQAVTKSTADKTYEKLQEHQDLKAAAEHLDPSAQKQQRGVWSQVVQVVEDVFVEDFRKEGSFSFREYVANPDGRAVVFESPEVSRSVGPMYRVMIDEAIEIAMRDSRDGFMLLDEVDTLPELSNISDLASRGLAQDTRMLLGVQTVGQLRDVYGRRADGVTGNCNQILGFTPGNDNGETVEFYQAALGERREMAPSSSRSRDAGVGGGNARVSRSRQETDRMPVDAHTMNHWGKGECLVSTRENWWVGQMAYYGDVKGRYQTLSS